MPKGTENANHDLPGGYRPTDHEVQTLVRRASAHPLGTRFLLRGSLDAVAATFAVHAHLVDAARQRLESEPRAGGEPAITVPSSHTRVR